VENKQQETAEKANPAWHYESK